MSYEIIRNDKTPCPCGAGCVRRVVKENDWFQQKESISIECAVCNGKYTVETEIVKLKPYHESVFYYLTERSGETPTRIKIEFT